MISVIREFSASRDIPIFFGTGRRLQVSRAKRRCFPQVPGTGHDGVITLNNIVDRSHFLVDSVCFKHTGGMGKSGGTNIVMALLYPFKLPMIKHYWPLCMPI
ncbi:MAG: hypothetical protein DSY89_10350 [Deltaproteobacteria bacterium]|nr:MAG: hypothetical protein DSY89_10350 [Deltaproteobacteria bacterium]